MNPPLSDPSPSLWMVLLGGGMAGGLGWGIRGQYGHETGAMIAGLLVCSVLTMKLAGHLPWSVGARAIALGTIAIGVGGSMTYGQTIGLTHDRELVGNLDSLRWGMIGLAVKGGIWIGFAGLFLGMGLGGQRYRPASVIALAIGMLLLSWLGIRLLNEPFDPSNKILPRLYFSDDWRWEPHAALKPRREVWGGLLLALVGAWIWAGFVRGDTLARRLGLWGVVGGALGFPIGQSFQSYHAWHPELFQTGLWGRLDPFMNWWNIMETVFGFVMGGILGLGLWFNRQAIGQPAADDPDAFNMPMVWLLLTIHTSLLLLAEFGPFKLLGALYDFGLVLALIPWIAVSGGGPWPRWLIFPVTLLPIAGKTIRQLVYAEQNIAPIWGWLFYGVIPIAAAIAASWFTSAKSEPQSRTTASRAAWTLLFGTWMYFALNFAFVHFPWPWAKWTGRTPNVILFTLFAAGLSIMAFRTLRAAKSEPSPMITPL